jgi:predicted naringenin-chalcone synthase
MFITGVGTAVPPDRYTQRDCYEALAPTRLYASLTPGSRSLLRKVLLGANGIEARHLAFHPITRGFELGVNTLHARFLEHAPTLATQAATQALANARCAREQIDALLISTCTGYLCPGLTSYVAERLQLRSDILALDLVGQGCGAALPNWRTAEALIASDRASQVLSICVEVCSAALYVDNDPGVLVSACLFGDGAAAMVLSREPATHGRRIQWRHSVSSHAPVHRNKLRFEHRNGLLRNLLTLEVPALAGEAVQGLLDLALARTGIARADIRSWILHAGGRDVLSALRWELDLGDDDLCWSEAVLREYGNLSSASVGFTLERALANRAPPGWWWVASFGAGFSCHGALLEVHD